MQLKHRFAAALRVLNERSSAFGVDRVVDSPLSVLERQLGVSRTVAWNRLTELERRNAIVVERDPKDGRSIARARILMEELPLRLHEQGDTDRVIAMLRKYKTRSQNGSWIVHSGFFPQVHGDADVIQARFYCLLKRLEENGFVEIVRDQYSTGEKILFITLMDSFPTG